jgi:hypothetical protein
MSEKRLGMFGRSKYLLLLSLNLAGCTATQLQWTTTNLGPSIADIEQREIRANLERFAEDKDAVPSQFVLGGGSATVSNQFQPSISSVNLTGVAIKAFGLQDQNQISVGWSVAPVTDFGDLQRLRALYRYALGFITVGEFVTEYTTAPAPALSTDSPMIAPRTTTNQLNQSPTSPTFHMPLPPPGEDLPDPATWDPPLPSIGGFISVNLQEGAAPFPGPAFPGARILYVRSRKELDNFTLWVIGATPSTTAGGGGGGGGGGKGGGARSLSAPSPPPLVQGGL